MGRSFVHKRAAKSFFIPLFERGGGARTEESWLFLDEVGESQVLFHLWVWAWACVQVLAKDMWKSVLWELVLSTLLSPRDQILAVRLDGKHFCSLSYLASPNYIHILINRKFSENSINCSLPTPSIFHYLSFLPLPISPSCCIRPLSLPPLAMNCGAEASLERVLPSVQVWSRESEGRRQVWTP